MNDVASARSYAAHYETASARLRDRRDAPWPLAVDLFCGLGGWTEGLLAEGWRVVGFDIVRHQYGPHRYPAQLVIQDVLTLHGSQFRSASLIVASPPCQAYSYRAMPWSRAKTLPPPDNTLFEACFRIQREACEAAGRHIPMVVENVRGAQSWVGRAAWHFGSFYLWGDVPALMPIPQRAQKVPGFRFDGSGGSFQTAAVKATGLEGIPHRTTERWTNSAEHEGVKQHGSGAAWWDKALDERRKEATAIKGQSPDGRKCGGDWFGDGNTSPMRLHSSGSTSRKFASAMIAKIPLPLSRHIAAVYYPRGQRAAA